MQGGGICPAGGRPHPCPCGGLMYEHRTDAMWLKAWKSTDTESRHLRSEATQGVWGVSPPMHEMPSSQRGRLKRVGLFFCCARAPLLQQLASSRTPLALLAPAPPIVICVIAARSLAPDGPHPLPVSGGGHASQRQLSPVTLHPGAPRAMYFLRLCARATSPNSTLTLALDLSLNRLKPWLYLISPKTASGSMGRILL